MAISLQDALEITQIREKPFDIKYVAMDLSKQIGGNIIELIDCRRVGASHNMKDNSTISVQQNNRKGHPYPVHIHLIQEVNGQEIYL